MIESKVGKDEGRYLYLSTLAALKLARVISRMMHDSCYAQKGPHALSHHDSKWIHSSCSYDFIVHWHSTGRNNTCWPSPPSRQSFSRSQRSIPTTLLSTSLVILLLHTHAPATSLRRVADKVARRCCTLATSSPNLVLSTTTAIAYHSPLVVSPAPCVIPVTASPSPFPPAATTLPVASVTPWTPLPTVFVAAPRVFPGLLAMIILSLLPHYLGRNELR